MHTSNYIINRIKVNDILLLMLNENLSYWNYVKDSFRIYDLKHIEDISNKLKLGNGEK
jgi:hypothetical protein